MKRPMDLECHEGVEPIGDFQLPHEFESYFSRIAGDLMLRRVLKAGNRVFRVVECEAYCRCDKFDDAFIHAKQQQLVPDSFYFHQTGNHGAFKGGSYKGLDFGFGNAKVFGGLLIRSLVDVATGEFISGPCLCVNALLEAVGVSSITDLVAKVGVLGEHPEFRLVRVESEEQRRVRCSMRVGLSLASKKTFSQHVLNMWGAPFRFFTEVIPKHRHLFVLQLIADGHSDAEIVAETKSKLAHVEALRSHFEEGKKLDPKIFFGKKPSSTKETAKCFGCFIASRKV